MRSEKHCAHCGEIKPIEVFARNGRTPEGRGCYCKLCHAARSRSSWERAKQRENAKRDSQRARRNAQLRERWRSDSTYRDAVKAARKARYRRRQGPYAQIVLGDPCAYCLAPASEVDHIEPIVRGGEDQWDNLTASCRSCNATKQGRSLLHFLAER